MAYIKKSPEAREREIKNLQSDKFCRLKHGVIVFTKGLSND